MLAKKTLYYLSYSASPYVFKFLNNGDPNGCEVKNENFQSILLCIIVPTNLNQHKNKHVVRDHVTDLKHTTIRNAAYIRQSV
jgi:hypothetical protein